MSSYRRTCLPNCAAQQIFLPPPRLLGDNPCLKFLFIVLLIISRVKALACPSDVCFCGCTRPPIVDECACCDKLTPGDHSRATDIMFPPCISQGPTLDLGVVSAWEFCVSTRHHKGEYRCICQERSLCSARVQMLDLSVRCSTLLPAHNAHLPADTDAYGRLVLMMDLTK